ncbi:MAG: hemolysin [Rheinheimera sp.]|uniref:HlyD family secretion protein n=1 Tax=Arsukibacterium sp. UBA3155 TaxID=1946058 RepID=UPI000C8C6827|nr:efflux RND transporter periplasmic adaptor subunit [Arsukibacterium sp. UBA3155]MAD76417.1 hemolysin [Rheinheimera sp.]|tara:strand:- start:62444 stop:63475 length:1032 start_codon:yes stop_codon:yes gene_type:complete
MKNLKTLSIVKSLAVLSTALLLNACQQENSSSAAPVFSSHVRATGELTAANSFKASPPSVSNMWQYNIKQLAPESSMLPEGAVVVAFDGQRLTDELNNKTIELKSAEQELANRLRSDEQTFEELKLTLAERKMEYDREQRKAEIVDQSRSANDRRKAQIDFTIADNQYQLAQARLASHQQQRQAEEQMLLAKVSRLQSEVSQLQRNIASMQVKAPFAGVMVYSMGFDGEKFSVGDSAQFGQPVAEVSQLDSLYIKAEIDEIDLKQLQPGLTVEVTLDAYPERRFNGVLQSLGNAVRDKSNDNLRRVVDASVSLTNLDTELMRPGMSARLNISLGNLQGEHHAN